MRMWPLLALALVGCGGCGGSDEPVGRTGSSDSDEAAGGSGVAVLEGTLTLADGAELAAYPENPMLPGPGRPEISSQCTPPREDDRTPVRRAAAGGLSGMLVALADFEREIPHEARTHRLSIEDCRLSPRLIVATRGDTLVLRNDTDYPYMPDLGTGMLQAVLYQDERELELGQGGVRTLQCGFAAQCGRAEVITLYHPLHTVTDEDGHYRIEGVPAGEELRVNAWHPLYQEANETITLRAGETRTVDFAMTPAAQPEVTAPTAPEGHPEDDPDVPIF